MFRWREEIFHGIRTKKSITLDLGVRMDYNKSMADWWNGIHRRLKISRPRGLAGSNPASATTTTFKEEK